MPNASLKIESPELQTKARRAEPLQVLRLRRPSVVFGTLRPRLRVYKGLGFRDAWGLGSGLSWLLFQTECRATLASLARLVVA